MTSTGCAPKSVEVVFACLAGPSRLTGRLRQVVRVDPDPARMVGLGSMFTVMVGAVGGELALAGETIAYEPAVLTGERLLADRLRLERASCNSDGGGAPGCNCLRATTRPVSSPTPAGQPPARRRLHPAASIAPARGIRGVSS